jgi:NAD+ kinase
MKAKQRVLVVYKKSAIDTYPEFRYLPRKCDEESLKLYRAHEANAKAITEAKQFFGGCRGLVKATWRHRTLTTQGQRFDLIVALGGDGTALEAAKRAGPNTPVVCINTAPGSSVGFYCAGNEVTDILASALRGELSEKRLQRMQVKIKKIVSKRVLNDILYCPVNPAATCRYTLGLEHYPYTHPQRSSGIWVGTASGSTGATLSAGGKKISPFAGNLQFVVRELCGGPAESALTNEVVNSVVIHNHTPDTRIYIDGPRTSVPVPVGSTITCSVSREPLTILGFRH